MNVSFGDGFFDTVLAYKVNYRWIINQANSLINARFSSIVELVFYMKDNFAFPKRSP